MRRLLIALLSAIAAPPIACWVWWQQRRILREGRPLSEKEAMLASQVGVQIPSALRVLIVDEIPMPGPRWFHRFAQGLGFPALTAAGMSLGRGIYWQKRSEHQLVILVHECVHAAQYERLGLVGFLRVYLCQCLRDGYVNAALEREAVDLSEAVCRSQH